ncbi:ALS2 C-terminal-like protein isoform X1 [Xenopus laevis]|uniref:ALS2 C-terminal-like protein isoform X1 n=3 Tax=Xenopus laevis TaxID=8355 RepID=A0A1L8FUW3_XENLA|nr:ALS2 C-terminal-like protein isoform X1 [Xenopus laevis]XP_018122522.1 ALS2 C-terminal-like protein isoform X1 [Xenopus laevis]XP_018122523.1 ALS2 C-terminal-like protein isoform X1 [Xenopus laevis]XP_041421681.1 ALS2 C-terminal-like protein isoform X1 [Xenopus laevis]OCT75387.1 hypothetical protein XELAEV_18030568mg [Xenopus laevis]
MATIPSITRRLARREFSSSKDGRLSVGGSVMKIISSTSVESLLTAEEDFLEYLSFLSTVALNALLRAGAVDPGNVKLLQHFNESFHGLWELISASYKTLKQTHEQNLALDTDELYLLQQATDFVQIFKEYFESVSDFMVVKGFDRAAKQASSYWKSNKKLLRQMIKDTTDGPVQVLLQRVFIDPFRNHVQHYTLFLSNLIEDSEAEPLTDVLNTFVELQKHISQILDEASQTKILWSQISNKLTLALCHSERRLQEDSRNVPVTVTNGRYERVLLFNDMLVFLQGHESKSFDLKTVWVDSTVKQKPEPNNYCLRIITPEDEIVLCAREPQCQGLWLWKINQLIRQALNGSRDYPLWGKTGEVTNPPTCRFSTYTFRNDGRFKDATYEGDMSWGKPHGKGTLKWPDGRNHVGDFKFGQEDGFGICLVPNSTQDLYDCYKCHWQTGSMQGYGICEYADESVYKGYFKDNMRHGFGILESMAPDADPFKYTGNWDKDKRSGYGVWESKNKGERYIGMWLKNNRHGPAIILTDSGACYQGTFHSNKMSGTGILLSEDSTMYEGEFTEDRLMAGKGKLTFSNGFTLIGTFNRHASLGLHTQGVLNTTSAHDDETIKRKFQLGSELFPVEERWNGIFEPFLKFLESGCQGETEEFFLGFHVQSSKKLQKSQEYLYCQRDKDEVSGKIEDILKEISVFQKHEDLQQYLEKAFKSSHHPFKKLLKIMLVVYQATYAGVGANLHLLSMAQEEIKYYAKKLLEFCRALIVMAGERNGHRNCILDENEETSDDTYAYTLILPLILPRFHPDLFMLYMLYHEQEDGFYWQGIIRLGHLTDTKLLEFLDVQKQLWPLKDVKLTTNQRYSIVRHKCFHSAIECLQKIITTVDPKEKLEIILKTYTEIERTVSRVVDKDYKLPMDDLLPLLIYVVSRAGIQHLGAEINFIRDLMEPSNRGGIYDFLLTALESCYEHIQKEEIRHYTC